MTEILLRVQRWDGLSKNSHRAKDIGYLLDKKCRRVYMYGVSLRIVHAVTGETLAHNTKI